MSKNNKVLIVDKMHESIMPLLSEIGFDPVYEPSIGRDEVKEKIGDYTGLVVRSKLIVDKELVNVADKLKFVARAGAGMDRLDTDYLKQKGIHILNAPEGNRDAVGEHAIGLLLNLLSKITISNDKVKNNLWKREEGRGIELKNKVVGIYGFGNTGESFARKLAGFGCTVVAFDKYKKGFSASYVEEVSLDEFREKVEILGLHVPLTNETRSFFNKEELLKYPLLKVVLNTARGEVLRLDGLLDLLEDGNLLGVGLDVLENEKLDELTESQRETFDRLIALNNVIVTPHVAGWTHESYERINKVLVEKIRNLGQLQ
ncbi:MAG: NAD(P)-dependent oxidoreductase [Cyclobacteriaceae bacterium]